MIKRGSQLNIRQKLIWVFIGLGIILRLKQYFSDRALWVDEARLAINIIDRSFSGLLQSLDYNQGAPVGFLMIEKLIIRFLGNSEYAFRLFPLLCGIASIFLFYKVAQYYLDKNAVPVAIFLFSFSRGLIYYSSETKQYSSDVAIVLLLFIVTIYIQSKRLNKFRMISFAFIGAIAIWFSHPAMFILVGIGTSLLLTFLSRRETKNIFRLTSICLIWLASFAVCYFVTLDKLVHLKPVLDWWNNAFMPLPPNPIWLVDSLLEFFQLHFNFRDIALPIFLIGCIITFLKNKVNFVALLLPIIAVLVASAFHKYPFHTRLILFLVPISILFITQGVEVIRVKTFNIFPLLSVILVGLLLFSVFYGAFYVQTNTKQGEIESVFSYLREHKQNEDVFFVFFVPFQMFRYYAERYNLGEADIQGLSFWDEDEVQGVEAFKKLRGKKRVWVLFFDVSGRRCFNKDKFFIYCADMVSKRLDFFQNKRVAVYLYDLSQEN